MLWRRGRRRGVLLLFLLLLILEEAVLALVTACVDGVLRRGRRHRPEKTKDAGRGRAAARTIHAKPTAMTSENATLKPKADGGRITRKTAMHNAINEKATTRIDRLERTPAATASTASPSGARSGTSSNLQRANNGKPPAKTASATMKLKPDNHGAAPRIISEDARP